MRRSSEPARVRPASQVSARYSALRREHTGPELALRRELHRRGLRYRVQQRIEGLPRRKVDIEVFSPAASLHCEEDERGGGDVADSVRADGDAA